MDRNASFELSKIQLELTLGIDLVSIITDGLCAYTANNALSGRNAERYVAALDKAYTMLQGASEKISEMLDCSEDHTEGTANAGVA